ncbi:VanZ family protein [Cellulomonas sp. NS3]|uniref:VanZ family protein n=1 Tax=Cellulomonas sp. NS3 TaxID=2973977 RepID=UPI002162B4D5|nr:VanZ family protein [Cellulomonas sp. NS3]
MTTTTSQAGHDGTAAPPRPAHVALVALFLVYLVLLGWTVLWKLEVPWVGDDAVRVLKLVPFVATADAGPSELPEVVLNALIFLPLGVYLGLLAPAWRWWQVAGVVAATSVGLEVAQYALAVGSADATDLVVNTAGGLAGLGVLARARRRLGARTPAVLVRVCAAGTVLALLAGAAVIGSPMRFGPPSDGELPPRAHDGSEPSWVTGSSTPRA